MLRARSPRGPPSVMAKRLAGGCPRPVGSAELEEEEGDVVLRRGGSRPGSGRGDDRVGALVERGPALLHDERLEPLVAELLARGVARLRDPVRVDEHTVAGKEAHR